MQTLHTSSVPENTTGNSGDGNNNTYYDHDYYYYYHRCAWYGTKHKQTHTPAVTVVLKVEETVVVVIVREYFRD